MLRPEAHAILAAAAATWPPARVWQQGPFLLREGRGGGKRVSAASAIETANTDDIARAEASMRAVGETPLFLIEQGVKNITLDLLLETRGYAVVDPVVVLAARLPLCSDAAVGIVTETRWPTTAAVRRLWSIAGIGPGRRAVMARAAHPKAVVTAHNRKKTVAAAFVGCHQGIAVVHALEVAPEARRQSIGGALMLAASIWAQEQGASHIAVLVTKANVPARALYASLALAPVADYHYRQLQP